MSIYTARSRCEKTVGEGPMSIAPQALGMRWRAVSSVILSSKLRCPTADSTLLQLMAPGQVESSRDFGSFAVDSAVICASMTGWIYTAACFSRQEDRELFVVCDGQKS